MRRFGRALLVIAGSLLAALLAYQAWLFAHVWWWSAHNPETTRFMRIRLAELRESNPQAQLVHQWVEYAQISNHLKRAVVAAEDDNFMLHNGFDWEGIQRAIERNQAAGFARAGG